jgi:hypothetical protein
MGNVLDKTLLFRGVEYNNFKTDPDKNCIGLIAREVELIIPEVVEINEMDNIKCISYNGLVALLIEAIKKLKNKVSRLEYILKTNNLSLHSHHFHGSFPWVWTMPYTQRT